MVVIEKSRNGARIIYESDEIPLFGEKYQARQNNTVGHSFLCCVFCGRDTSKQGKSQGVVVSDGGASIVQIEDVELEENDRGYMGWFPVGSECIKAVPKEFRCDSPYKDKVKGV